MTHSEIIKSFKSYLKEIKEKVDKCDNNVPYNSTDLMETTQDYVLAKKSLSPREGYEIRHELYEILKNFKKCDCRVKTKEWEPPIPTKSIE